MPRKSKNGEISHLLQFLEASPTAWHAEDFLFQWLVKEGFEPLHEGDSWKLKPGRGYVVSRNKSSLCAFVVPNQPPASVKVIGAHTDSPTFKLKPNAEFIKENMIMLGLEIYGGPLITSWLNRDLGIAGRVIFKDKKGKRQEALVRLDENPVIIPQLAIHLDRQVNENGLLLNKQEQLAALAALTDSANTKNKPKEYLKSLIINKIGSDHLLAWDLFVYPLDPPRLVGKDSQMVSSYRIDNLTSVHAGMTALIGNKKPHAHILKMVAFWDHEEIGSHTAIGAGSPFLPQTIERICLSISHGREEYFKLLQNGLCVSVDMSHALHPNYSDKHEPRHQLLMDQGIIIKTNAQYRYASDARSISAMIDLCERNKIPFQKYVGRGDIPAGSTIGPIHAGLTGMQTVDVGCAQLSMHSCRELFSCQDHLSMCRLLSHFLQDE
jgi:aspartyl aminopeptidase